MTDNNEDRDWSETESIRELTDAYYQFCKTKTQYKYLESYLRTRSSTISAEEFGINPSNIRKSLNKVIRAANIAGYNPSKGLDRDLPVGFKLKGFSDMRTNEEGKPVWFKYDQDKAAQEKLFTEFVNALGASLEAYKPIPEAPIPQHSDEDLLTVYPLGDPHIGMYSWAEETGYDFDCDIAEKQLRAAMRYLVSKSPNSKTAIILNVGDFFHSDNQSNRTARAGNALDVDTRWARVLQIGIILMTDCVYMALNKHEKVIVKNNIGNHDDHTSQVLSICMMHAFKDNPRVEIAAPQQAFFAFEFGNCSIFSTHGHMIKPNKMQGVVANYFPEIWGRTVFRLCILGHFHHEQRFEDNGLITEIINTLASPDAWHYSSGYKSLCNMKSITFHRLEGEIERYTYNLRRILETDTTRGNALQIK